MTKQCEIPKHADTEGGSPLHYAARRGASETVSKLLSKGADPNARDKHGRTPLHRVAHRKCVEVTALLLENGADPNAADGAGITPLMRMIHAGGRLNAQLLLSFGADPNRADTRGRTPLHQVIESSRSTRWIRLLLSHGADPSITDGQGFTPLVRAKDTDYEPLLVPGASPPPIPGPLHWAALHNRAVSTRVLLERGFSPNESSWLGRTPLHLAAGNGAAEAVELLLSHGANADTLDHTGDLPLHLAVKRGDAATVRPLMSATTNINRNSGDGRTVLNIAVENKDDATAVLLLEEGDADPETLTGYSLAALISRHINRPEWAERIKRLTNSRLASRPSDDCLGIILGDAAKNDQLDLLDLLLTNGVDPNTPGRDGTRALCTAAFNGKTESLNRLIHYGADVNRRGIEMWSPLYSAVLGQKPEIVRTLLESGAKVNAPLADGTLPLFKAVRADSIETVEILIEYGADPNQLDSNGNSVWHELLGRRLNRFQHRDRGDLINIAKLLLEHGADAGIMDSNGESPLDLPPFSWILDYRTVSEIADLLLIAGANPADARCFAEEENGFPALVWAAEKGHLSLVSLLVKKNVHPDSEISIHARGAGGRPLSEAAEHGHLEVARFLLENGAEPDFFIHAPTALCSAIVAGHLKIAELLLDHGADPNLAGGQGYNLFDHHRYDDVRCEFPYTGRPPLDVAAGLNRVEIATLLIERGADVLQVRKPLEKMTSEMRELLLETLARRLPEDETQRRIEIKQAQEGTIEEIFSRAQDR